MSLSDQSQQWYPTSVQVTVLQARSLRIKGKNGTNDAYAIMQVAKDKFATSVAEKSVAPVWKEEATFELPLFHNGNTEKCTLHVHVMHRALVGPDKLLGQAVINLLELSEVKSRNKTEWHKLLDKAGKPDKDRGEVLVDIQFMKNNLTASMFDLSATDKPRSRLRKFKDKVRGKKEGLSDSASAVVPSFTQVLTDSEGEGEGVGKGSADKEEQKKKNKLKSLFSPKSNLQCHGLSQSMSVLGPLPENNSSLSGSRSTGLNVDSSEGKNKFKFLTHKRTGSSLSLGRSKIPAPLAEQSNLCINGTHMYTEEPQPRSTRTGSNFSLASSGHGSMEDLRKAQGRKSSGTSMDSFRALKKPSPWAEEEERVTMDEEKKRKEEQESKKLDEEERIRKEEQEKRRITEEEGEEIRLEEEQDDRSLKVEGEERVWKEDQEKWRLEEKRREMEEQEKWEKEERIRREEHERMRREDILRKEDERKMRHLEERLKREKDERIKEEEERIRREQNEEDMQREEEDRKMREEEEVERRRGEERMKREAEERMKREEDRLRKEEEEEMRIEEEEQRMKREEDRLRKEEEERMKKEEDRLRKEEEEERMKREDDRVRKEEEEERRRRIEEEEQRMKREAEEERMKMEEDRLRKEEEEEERMKREEDRLRKEEEEERMKREEDRLRKEEEEERMKREEEEERRRIEEGEERMKREAEEERMKRKDRLRKEEEEERRRRIEEEEQRMKREAEEERMTREEDRLRKEEEEERRRRIEKEEERMKREEDRLRKEEEEEEERRRIEEGEERMKREEDRVRKEEEEERRIEEEEERMKREEDRLRKEEEEERMKREEDRLRKEEEEERMKREEDRVRKEEEEERRIEEEEQRIKREEDGLRKEERKIREEEERVRKAAEEDWLREEMGIKRMEERIKREEEDRLRKEEELRKIMEKEKRLREEEDDMRRKEKEQRKMRNEEERRIEQEMLRKEEAERTRLEEEREEEKRRDEEQRKLMEAKERFRLDEENMKKEQLRGQEEKMTEKEKKTNAQMEEKRRHEEVRVKLEEVEQQMKQNREAEAIVCNNPFEEVSPTTSCDDTSSNNPFEETPTTSSTRCRTNKVSAVKPRPSSWVNPSQPSVSSNPFLSSLSPEIESSMDSPSVDGETRGAQDPSTDLMEKKDPAPLPPNNQRWARMDNWPSKGNAHSVTVNLTQTKPTKQPPPPRRQSSTSLVGYGDDQESVSGQDHSSIRMDKGTAPDRPSQAPSQTQRNQSMTRVNLGHKDIVGASMSKVSQRVVQMITPLRSSYTATTEHTCGNQPEQHMPSATGGLRVAKHNKGPAPSRPQYPPGKTMPKVDVLDKQLNSEEQDSLVEFDPNNPFAEDCRMEKSSGHGEEQRLTGEHQESLDSHNHQSCTSTEENPGSMQNSVVGDSMELPTPDVLIAEDGSCPIKNTLAKRVCAPLPPLKKTSTSREEDTGKQSSVKLQSPGASSLSKLSSSISEKMQNRSVGVALTCVTIAQPPCVPSPAPSFLPQTKSLKGSGGRSDCPPQTSSLPDQRTLLQAGAVSSIAEHCSGEEAGGRGDRPISSTRRPHPVKPLSSLENQPASNIQEGQAGISTGFLSVLQEKIKVKDTGVKGQYSQLTQEELISLVVKQQDQLSKRDNKIKELEQYIDNLLVRIIEEQPSILMSMNSLK
uniref:Rab11 family-interacting protein 1-like n=1 Tax=Hucho hucho TaxID=62062 RepID=A0A4W5N3P3_9TELE